MYTPPVTDRTTKVSTFFGEHATSWKRRYSAHQFDDWEYQTRGRIALEWLAALRPPGGGRLLEIGCGAGVQSVAAARQGWKVVSVDFAERMLREGQRQSKQPQWMAAAVEALPFRPHSFDAVLMNGVIGYVVDPQQALRSVREQLRPHGTFIVSWASPHPLLVERISHALSVVPDTIYLGFKQLLTQHHTGSSPHQAGFYDEYLRRWRPKEFYSLLESAGFTIDQVRSQNFGQFRLMDHSVWSERVDIGVSEWLDRWAGTAPDHYLRVGARTHIALVTAC